MSTPVSRIDPGEIKLEVVLDARCKFYGSLRGGEMKDSSNLGCFQKWLAARSKWFVKPNGKNENVQSFEEATPACQVQVNNTTLPRFW
jgi:hypothetical protein